MSGAAEGATDRYRANLYRITGTCPNEPHERGLRYDVEKDVLVCPVCGHEQYEEMGI